MDKPSIAVFAPDPSYLDKATAIAQKLNLPYFQSDQAYQFLLLVTTDYIGIQPYPTSKIKPLYVDFLSPTMQYRKNQASLRKEAIARAMGVKPQDNPIIVDATAGLACDSFILASLGFTVTLLERSPILHLLVDNAIQRAVANPIAAPIVNRLQLIHTNAITWFEQYKLAENPLPHVIYLDPMFPERRKSAQVKKEMRMLQAIIGEDNDADQLFMTALTCATQRVVVKRPRLAPPLAGRPPAFQLLGKSSRFDVYITR